MAVKEPPSLILLTILAIGIGYMLFQESRSANQLVQITELEQAIEAKQVEVRELTAAVQKLQENPASHPHDNGARGKVKSKQ